MQGEYEQAPEDADELNPKALTAEERKVLWLTRAMTPDQREALIEIMGDMLKTEEQDVSAPHRWRR